MSEKLEPSWTENKKELEKLARSFNRHIKIYTKDNWFCKTIAWLLFLLSFGRYKKEKFLTKTATALGSAHFYPKEWNKWEVEWVLPHEARHTIHFLWLGFKIHPLIGMIPAAIIYLFILFPVYLAFGRFFMELDCNKFRWKWFLSKINTQKELDDYRFDLLYATYLQSKTLSGLGYFYAVPQKISWYFSRKMIKGLINEKENSLG